MATHARLKVLISAYACSPYRGSEPGVGWGFVHALSRRHDLWVLVEEEKCRDDLERYLRDHPELSESVRFVFIHKRRNRLLRRVWPPSYYRYYREWHASAAEVARRLHREVGFDVAHQLTMVGFREPGYLWQLGLPYVWGPVGGMGLFPWRFLGRVGAHGAAFYAAYNLYNAAQMRWMRRPRLAARAAGPGLITATRENREGALRFWGCASETIAEVGLPPAPPVTPSRRTPGEPLRLVWSGQHIPRKALNLGLEALARVPVEVGWRLDVLGRGPETENWERLARRLGIADRCRFHGWIDRAAALDVTRSAHAMLISSLRDLTSTVIVEGLALGLPVVCPDHCGFADVIDEACGIKVPMTSPEVLVRGLANAIERLGTDEPLRLRLAAGALRRARAYDWSAKAEQVDAIYRRVLRSRPPARDTLDPG